MLLTEHRYGRTNFKCKCGKTANYEVHFDTTFHAKALRKPRNHGDWMGSIRGCEECVKKELRDSAEVFTTFAGHPPEIQLQPMDEMNVLRET